MHRLQKRPTIEVKETYYRSKLHREHIPYSSSIPDECGVSSRPCSLQCTLEKLLFQPTGRGASSPHTAPHPVLSRVTQAPMCVRAPLPEGFG
jgi:hypothetical protein